MGTELSDPGNSHHISGIKSAQQEADIHCFSQHDHRPFRRTRCSHKVISQCNLSIICRKDRNSNLLITFHMATSHMLLVSTNFHSSSRYHSPQHAMATDNNKVIKLALPISVTEITQRILPSSNWQVLVPFTSRCSMEVTIRDNKNISNQFSRVNRYSFNRLVFRPRLSAEVQVTLSVEMAREDNGKPNQLCHNLHHLSTPA
mmetsp:Transcript_1952/g.3001  ORF Transcript_1952/g.3001 Transcript_1952/m.3001 type:complete len:202 (-) Transcript_1952:979-1584(-)